MSFRRPSALFAIALFGTVLVSSCTIRTEQIGNRLSEADLRPLATLTSKREVLETIGPPSTIELLPDGSAFTYRCALGEGTQLRISALEASYDSQNSDRRQQLLRITFDKRGQLRDYGFSVRPFDENTTDGDSP